MPCRYYHIQTIKPKHANQARTVRVRSGRIYGQGRVLAEGYESGIGDVVPQLVAQCLSDGTMDQKSRRHVAPDWDIPPHHGEKLVPIEDQR
jgi:hypothetical protein